MFFCSFLPEPTCSCLVFLAAANSQRSFRPCDRARRDLYFPRPTRFHVAVISSPRMILTRLARLGEQWHSDAVFGSIIHFTFSGQRFGELSVGQALPAVVHLHGSILPFTYQSLALRGSIASLASRLQLQITALMPDHPVVADPA